jgi:hypothetical protein
MARGNRTRSRLVAATSWIVAASAVVVVSCAAGEDPGPVGPGSSASAAAGGAGGVGGLDAGDCRKCAPDGRGVVDCAGAVLEACGPMEACSASSSKCVDACQAAVDDRLSVGCEYHATLMARDNWVVGCFAAFVANTWNEPVHLTVEYDGEALDVDDFARIPKGAGAAIEYQPFDEKAGLPPGEVAILFLSGPQAGEAGCPVPSAIQNGVQLGMVTAIGKTFRIASDGPVVAYQMSPYGGGSAAVTGASLLLPVSVWDDNYVAVNAAELDLYEPSMNVVAAQDDTQVTLLPVVDVVGGGGIPGGPAGVPLTFTLHRGEHAQITQEAELTGSILQSDKPVGFLAGQPCMRKPKGVPYCDHAEQMVPPVRALGHEYVGVMHRPRIDEPAIWKIIGAADDTVLTWSSDVGGPATLARGQAVEVETGEPFVVRSQDAEHPFLLFSYMTSSEPLGGRGDADFVIGVPTGQYATRYVFFADPTYPETNLVVVRARSEGSFAEVTLDCAGALDGWTPVGDYEWTRVDLTTGDFEPVGGCSTGRREMTSSAPFAVWVWGWGTPETSIKTRDVSYGYPAGMNVQRINDVVVPIPK